MAVADGNDHRWCGRGCGKPDLIDDSPVVRGLEYYTGPVFEADLTFEISGEDGKPVRFGSVGVGGRGEARDVDCRPLLATLEGNLVDAPNSVCSFESSTFSGPGESAVVGAGCGTGDGKVFIANPDLVERLKTGAPLAEIDWATVYASGPQGYSHYPALQPATA